jgi:uroporphyrinogen-III synthase
VPELEHRRLRIERLEQQLQKAGFEPEQCPPIEKGPQSKPLRAVDASESESAEG